MEKDITFGKREVEAEMSTCKQMRLFLPHRMIALVFILLLVTCCNVIAENSPDTYCTGNVLEVARCASAWLIKRFVNKNAHFIFLTEEELMSAAATPFDTPTATLRRTHDRSTFEVIRDKYSISNDHVNFIARVVHDIEINFWNKKKDRESQKIEQDIQTIIREAGDSDSALLRCFVYFDSLKF